MFDNISPKYDFLNHLLSFGIDRLWRKQVRRLIGKNHPERILDVATGTGDLAIELCHLGNVKITAVDLSQGMLNKGIEKIARLGLNNKITMQQADSENLPFQDNSFDAVTVAFGVRNFEDLEKGMREMNRVLQTGGQLAVLEFSKPHNRFFSAIYWFYFRHILPGVGRLFSKDSRAYSYLPQSVAGFPEGNEFAAIAKKCGFSSVKIQPMAFGISTIYLCAK